MAPFILTLENFGIKCNGGNCNAFEPQSWAGCSASPRHNSRLMDPCEKAPCTSSECVRCCKPLGHTSAHGGSCAVCDARCIPFGRRAVRGWCLAEWLRVGGRSPQPTPSSSAWTRSFSAGTMPISDSTEAPTTPPRKRRALRPVDTQEKVSPLIRHRKSVDDSLDMQKPFKEPSSPMHFISTVNDGFATASITDCWGSSSAAAHSSSSRPLCTSSSALCATQLTKACAECKGFLCPDCHIRVPDCVGCGKPLCGNGACEGFCIDCGSVVCSGCALAVYDRQDACRRCFGCAVKCSGRSHTTTTDSQTATCATVTTAPLPVPTTPPRTPRRHGEKQVHSGEKVARPRRFRTNLSISGNERRLVETAISGQMHPPLSTVNIKHMKSRAESDEVYWEQIKSAYELLTNSTQTELALREAVDRNERIISALFRGAIEAQETDRLSALVMLNILRELVAEGNRSDNRI